LTKWSKNENLNSDSPIIMAGTAMPATSPIPTGAPTSVPNCHINFFFLDQGFFPQNVQPDGLKPKNKKLVYNSLNSLKYFDTYSVVLGIGAR
jgi:hypothetical protein